MGALYGRDRGDHTRRAEQEHKEEVSNYYQRGLYHGRAVAHTLYDLAHSLQRESADLLWYAIVGLTDQYVHQRVADETYEEAQQQLETCLEHPSSTVTLDNGMDVPIAADSHIRCVRPPWYMYIYTRSSGVLERLIRETSPLRTTNGLDARRPTVRVVTWNS